MSRARATLGVSSRTLRRDTASGKREDLRSPGGHRVFRMADLHVLNAEHEDKRTGVLIYARVSCAGQNDDLVRQIEDLERAAEGRVVLATFSDVRASADGRHRLGSHSGDPPHEMRVVVDEHEHKEPGEENGVDVEEVARHQPLRLGGEELRPGRSRPAR